MTVQSPHTFRIVRVSADTLHVYNHLCQSYEGEFSAITAKLPGPDGIFPLDTHIDMQKDGAVQGWLLYEGEHPIGFAAVRHEGHEGHEGHEMCEFYIVPARRRCGAGTYFAHALFTAHPGAWEIKQLPDAVQATHFWRRTIALFTPHVQEDNTEDAYWGAVVRQRFMSPPHS